MMTTAPRDPGQASTRATILLAEDEDALRKVAVRALERLGYRVLAASDGQEALEMFHAHGPEIDLVISDSAMPNMGGAELYERLRREGASVRFLLASGYAADVMDALSSPGGRIPFLQKPWTLATLQERVEQVLEAPPPA
ncbi:MAG TPA: response regulator [Gemmatimonadaceae bacterium]|nr:response regulator [Gemmatimonadaceae bacterium]